MLEEYRCKKVYVSGSFFASQFLDTGTFFLQTILFGTHFFKIIFSQIHLFLLSFNQILFFFGSQRDAFCPKMVLLCRLFVTTCDSLCCCADAFLDHNRGLQLQAILYRRTFFVRTRFFLFTYVFFWPRKLFLFTYAFSSHEVQTKHKSAAEVD